MQLDATELHIVKAGLKPKFVGGKWNRPPLRCPQLRAPSPSVPAPWCQQRGWLVPAGTAGCKGSNARRAMVVLLAAFPASDCRLHAASIVWPRRVDRLGACIRCSAVCAYGREEGGFLVKHPLHEAWLEQAGLMPEEAQPAG